MRRVLDYMLSAWSGRGSIDPSKIGIYGFSLGGVTARVVIGGTPDLAQIPRFCASHSEAPECQFIRQNHGDQLTPAPAASPHWTHDRESSRCSCRVGGLAGIRHQRIARSPRPRAVVARFERPAGARCLEFPVGVRGVACQAGRTRGGQRRTYGLPFVQRDSTAIGRLDVPGGTWVRPRFTASSTVP